MCMSIYTLPVQRSTNIHTSLIFCGRFLLEVSSKLVVIDIEKRKLHPTLLSSVIFPPNVKHIKRSLGFSFPRKVVLCFHIHFYCICPEKVAKDGACLDFVLLIGHLIFHADYLTHCYCFLDVDFVHS